MIANRKSIVINFEKNNALQVTYQVLKDFDKLINNYDKLNDIEKYKLLLNIYNILLSYDDFISYINYKYTTNFDKIIAISCEFRPSIYNKFILDCASTSDFKPESKRYSYDEIINLINNGKIYPIYGRIFTYHKYNDEFDKEIETTPGNPYNSDYDENVAWLLEKYPIKILIPNEIKLSNYDSAKEFYCNEKTFTEDNIDVLKYILEKDPLFNKTNIIQNSKKTLKEFKDNLEWYEDYSPKEAFILKKVRKYYNENFKNNKK